GPDEEPGEPRVPGVGLDGASRDVALLPVQDGLERGPRGEGAAHALRFRPPRECVGGGGGARDVEERSGGAGAVVALEDDRRGDAGGQAANVGAARRARARRKRLAAGETLLEWRLFGQVGRAQQLEEAEEAVGVVLEGDR